METTQKQMAEAEKAEALKTVNFFEKSLDLQQEC